MCFRKRNNAVTYEEYLKMISENKKIYDYSDHIDYTGKLNNHEDYLKMLDILEKKTAYIEIAYKNEIVKKFKKDITHKEYTVSWFSETSYPGADLYRITASKELFEFLKKYETFCKYIVGGKTIHGYTQDLVEETDFGISDIGFFDKDNKILLDTTTHEGFINVDKDIDKLFNKK